MKYKIIPLKVSSVFQFNSWQVSGQESKACPDNCAITSTSVQPFLPSN